MAASKEFPIEFRISSWRERRLYDGKEETVYQITDDAREFVPYETTSKEQAWGVLKIRAEELLKDGYDIDLPDQTPQDIISYLVDAANVVEVTRITTGGRRRGDR